MSDELKRITFAKLLSDFTSDDLLEELARRESGNGEGGVIHHRVRIVTRSDVICHNNEDGVMFARVQVMIDGEWRGQDWIRDPYDYTPRPLPIHKGAYD